MRSQLTNRAKELRKNATDAERLLWKYLRARQLYVLKFRRQHPIDNYIVDFICIEKKLIIELDGGQHAMNKEKDIKRDNTLKDKGYKVVRFWNNEVLSNIVNVLDVIKNNF